MSVRHWLIDVPARATELAAMWYRLYLMVLLFVAGPVLVLTVLLLLVLQVFGIRWGW